MLCRAIRSGVVQPWKCALGGGSSRLMCSGTRSPPPKASQEEGDLEIDDLEIDESYGIRKTVEWLQDAKRKHKFKEGFALSKMVDAAVYSGVHLRFPHGLTLSVETHPVVCSSDFAETVILPTEDTAPDLDVDECPPRLVALGTLGYSVEDFTMRHKEPTDLFRHISKFREILEDAKPVGGVLQLTGGECIDLRRNKSKDKQPHILVNTVEKPGTGLLLQLAKQALY